MTNMYYFHSLGELKKYWDNVFLKLVITTMYILDTVKQENLAHTYFSANANSYTLAQIKDDIPRQMSPAPFCRILIYNLPWFWYFCQIRVNKVINLDLCESPYILIIDTLLVIL